MDLNSATDNTCFVLSEIYESKAGVLDHFKQADKNWGDIHAFREWLEKAKSHLCLQLPFLTHSGEGSGFTEGHLRTVANRS